MARILVIMLIIAVVLGGAAFAFREQIGCFLYLREAHEKQIAYMKEDGIYVMEADGSNQCRILEDNSYLEIAWSPDGEQLAIFNLDGNLYTARPNGSNLQEIVSATNIQDRQRPAWSPDSARIAYVRNEEAAGLYVVDVASGSESQIVEGLPALFPVWSPEGDWIAFSTEEDTALYVVRADGSDLRQLSSETQVAAQPSWAADGQRIFFVTQMGEIAMIDLDGSDEEVITRFSDDYDALPFYIAGSPAGDRIAAETHFTYDNTPSGNRLVIIDLETGEPRILPTGDQDPNNPVWSPDGEHLLYTEFPSSLNEGTLYQIDIANDQIERLATGNVAVPRP